MGIEFYFDPLLSACRAVQLTLSTLTLNTYTGIQIDSIKKTTSDERDVNLLRINPQYTVPTLVDNGLVLTDSRAIQIYLVEKYGRDEKLYPKNIEARAIVNDMLFLEKFLSDNFFDYWYMAKVLRKVPDKHRLSKITTAIKNLDYLLHNKAWAAGDYMTIADFALIPTISDVQAFDIALDACPNICAWYEKCKQVIPGYEVNEMAAKELRTKFNSIKR